MRKRWWLLGSATVAGTSFLSLYYIVTKLWPNPDSLLAQPQLLFFTFIFLGVGSCSIPVAVYLNQRFSQPSWLERDKSRLLRQGTWVGTFLVILAYLQMSKTINLTITAVLAGVFILIETFFLTRD
jgi:hypothetical protein